jgi:acylphosphatase
MKKHIELKITGKLKNTGIRFHVMSTAYRYNIVGTVKRLSDTEVLISAEGERIPLDNFLTWCKTGPPGGKIENIEYSEGELMNYSSFELI